MVLNTTSTIFMVLNATFNNISVISCWSVLLEKESGVPGEKTTGLSQVTDKHNVVSSTSRHERGSNSTV